MRLNRIFKMQYPDFDLKRADWLLCESALLRATAFAQFGDSSAADANLTFWKDHAPIIKRAKKSIRAFAGRAVRWI
jgi:hypothetical protein